MRLANEAHLAYCTNIHPGNDWAQTFHSLRKDTLAVRRAVRADDAYAIGLRLSAAAAIELSDPATLLAFQRWLEAENCYVFTINGFPYGNFHGQRVKEQVYRPDWTSPDRLEYTNRLFDLLAQLLPAGHAGSVSTLPGSFKRFIESEEQIDAIEDNLYRSFRHISDLSERHGIDLHLGLEPEPLGLFENTSETIAFFDRFTSSRSDGDAIRSRIGVNYDTCHFALEYESAADSLSRFAQAGIRISKIHLSSALTVAAPCADTLDTLEGFCEEVYLHQVLAREADGSITRYEDLDQAIEIRRKAQEQSEEWRIHFHIPIHEGPELPLGGTNGYLLETLDAVEANPALCAHFEIETYTWAVLPKSLRDSNVVDQIVKEYQWLFPELEKRGLLR